MFTVFRGKAYWLPDDGEKVTIELPLTKEVAMTLEQQPMKNEKAAITLRKAKKQVFSERRSNVFRLRQKIVNSYK